MKKIRCLVCGCLDVVLDEENPLADQVCYVCRDERTVKPNRYTVFRVPEKLERTRFGRLVEKTVRKKRRISL